MSEAAAATREKRTTKVVERMTIEVKEKDEFTIEAGDGEKLGDIENVAFQIGKLNSASEELKTLHRYCYGRAGGKTEVKKNLREFSGLTGKMKGDRAKKAEAMNKVDSKLIKAILNVCDLSPTGTKKDLIERLIDFLEKPESSGKRSLVEKAAQKRKVAEKAKEKKEKKAAKASKGKGKGKEKKEKTERAPSAYILYCNSRRDKVKGENPDASMVEITKILAEKWRGISDERKAKYEQQSKELKEELEKKKGAKAKAKGEPPAKKQKKEAAAEEEKEEAKASGDAEDMEE